MRKVLWLFIFLVPFLLWADDKGCVRNIKGSHTEVTLAPGNGFLSILDTAKVDYGWLSAILDLNEISDQEAANPQAGLVVCVLDKHRTRRPPAEVKARSDEILSVLLNKTEPPSKAAPVPSESAADPIGQTVEPRELSEAEKTLSARIAHLEKKLEELEARFAVGFTAKRESGVGAMPAPAANPNWWQRTKGAVSRIPWGIILNWFLLGLAFVVLISIALLIWGAIKRFRAARNSWRGIRDSFYKLRSKTKIKDNQEKSLARRYGEGEETVIEEDERSTRSPM